MKLPGNPGLWGVRHGLLLALSSEQPCSCVSTRVCTGVHVCGHVCRRVCICMSKCVCMHGHVRTYVLACICGHVCMNACRCTHTHTYMNVLSVHVCMSVQSVCVPAHVCAHMYSYVCLLPSVTSMDCKDHLCLPWGPWAGSDRSHHLTGKWGAVSVTLLQQRGDHGHPDQISRFLKSKMPPATLSPLLGSGPIFCTQKRGTSPLRGS